MSAGTSVPRNGTELVERFENAMGWDPIEVSNATGKPVWQVKVLEVSKLNRWMKKNPRITLRELAITLDWCVKEGHVLKTPYGLTFHVKDAMKAYEQPEVVTDLETTYAQAISIEESRTDPERLVWLGRFARAVGPGRQELYDDWKARRA